MSVTSIILGILIGLAMSEKRVKHWQRQYYRMTKYIQMTRDEIAADQRDIKTFTNLCETGDTFQYKGAELVVMPVEKLYNQNSVN